MRQVNTPSLLGGSRVVITGFIRSLIWVIAIVALLFTPLIAPHEPPSKLAKDSSHQCALGQRARSAVLPGSLADIRMFPKIRGTLFCGPYNKDPVIWVLY